MRKILVCQHVPFEILGTLDPLFKAAGMRIRYVNFGRHPDAQPSLDGYGGLVVLGGPMSVDQVDRHPHLITELALIRKAIDRNMPVLGICLGAQLIAKALGSAIHRNPEKEIGWYDVSPTASGREDPLLSHFRSCEKLFQWHGDTFATPEGAVHLASSPTCATQAFRYGRNVYGFQFHLEADERLIERWLRTPVFRREIESLHGRISTERIRHETREHIGRLKQLSDRTFGEFVKLCGVPNRRRLLSSR
ncbi:MAG: gamma-glutamyl-gamma-aminobutyrate hydrolase family protein [Candidatus Binatia bacterium]